MDMISRLDPVLSAVWNGIYATRPLGRVFLYMLLGVLLWTVLAVGAERRGREDGWRRFCAVFAAGCAACLLYMTVMSRSETPYGGLHLRPFVSFTLAREENAEYYRSMLMNVYLFFPFGLAAPFALSRRRRPVLLTCALAACLSVCIEAAQYALSLGWAETDDVIMNTLGALIGGASHLAARLIRRHVI